MFLSLFFWCKNIHKGISIAVSIVSCAPIWPPTNNFLKILLLAGLPQITFLKVWHFRARRKSFPKRSGISALGESRFPNGLGLVVAKIWNKNLSGFWIYNYQGASIGTVSTIFSTYFVLHKKSFYGIKLESKFKTFPIIKIKSEQEIHSCPLINILI